MIQIWQVRSECGPSNLVVLVLQYRVLGYIKDNTPSYLCIQVTDKKKNKLKLFDFEKVELTSLSS